MIKTSPAISHRHIIDALPFDQKYKGALEDELIEWFDGRDFLWASFESSYNFETLPQDIQTFLRHEITVNHFMIYFDN